MACFIHNNFGCTRVHPYRRRKPSAKCNQRQRLCSKVSRQKRPCFLSNEKGGGGVRGIGKGGKCGFRGERYMFYMAKQHILHRKTRHFTPQYAAFCSVKCHVSAFEMPFSAAKRSFFIAHIQHFFCNHLILRVLSLHTFPCRFYGLRDFYLQTPPYFGVMENQLESVMAQIVTCRKNGASLFQCNLSSLRFICIIFA